MSEADRVYQASISQGSTPFEAEQDAAEAEEYSRIEREMAEREESEKGKEQ
jgi:hypothetical protein